MHDRQDRGPRTSRPSLLSPESASHSSASPDAAWPGREANPDQRGILSQMEGGAVPVRRVAGRQRQRAGLAAGALALVVAVVGGVFWFAASGVAPDDAMALASAPAPAVGAVSEAAPGPSAGPPVPASAARIQDEALAEVAQAGVPAASSGAGTLVAALEAGPAAGGAEAGGEVGALLAGAAGAASTQAAAKATTSDKARPAGAKRQESRTAAQKAARADKNKAAPARASKAAPVDADAALLAALLAHAKHPDGARQSTEFARCAALPSVTEAQRCRERLCKGSARGAGECKAVRVSKVSG